MRPQLLHDCASRAGLAEPAKLKARRAAQVCAALFSGVLAFGLIVGVDGSAQAGTACAASIENNVTGSAGTNSGCEVGSSNNDSAAQVNLDNMFSTTNWEQAQKTEGINATSGDFNLATVLGVANPFDVYANIMVVLKGAADYVGYLLIANDFAGDPKDWTVDWLSPFFNQNDQRQDVSHISIYVTPIPLPAALPLLLAALAGLAMFGWVRRRQAAGVV